MTAMKIKIYILDMPRAGFLEENFNKSLGKTAEIIKCIYLRKFFNYKKKNKTTNQQEAHGAHCSPERQLQSTNTFEQSYDYTVRLIKR